jgi:hypothetical protein
VGEEGGEGEGREGQEAVLTQADVHEPGINRVGTI